MQEWMLVLFGGLNIVQLISYQHLRRKYKADADIQAVEATKAECLLYNDQYDYLIEKLQYFQEEHYKLIEKVNKQTENHIIKIQQLNNEIYVMRAEVLKYKLLTCSRQSCQQRIQESDK